MVALNLIRSYGYASTADFWSVTTELRAALEAFLQNHSGLLIVTLAVMMVFSGFKLLKKKPENFTLNVNLATRKQWNSFDPDLYLKRLDSKTASRVSRFLKRNPRSKQLELNWSYVPASGAVKNGSKSYKADDKLKSLLKESQDVLAGGKRKVRALNESYANSLKCGREIEDAVPKIYCYQILNSRKHKGLVKVGYSRGSAHRRILQQVRTAARLDVEYRILFVMPAVTVDDEAFKDYDVHKELREANVANPEGEWFQCTHIKVRNVVKRLQGL